MVSARIGAGGAVLNAYTAIFSLCGRSFALIAAGLECRAAPGAASEQPDVRLRFAASAHPFRPDAAGAGGVRYKLEGVVRPHPRDRISEGRKDVRFGSATSRCGCPNGRSRNLAESAGA